MSVVGQGGSAVQTPLSDLPDETGEHERSLYSSLAKEIEPEWTKLTIALMDAGSGLQDLLKYALRNVPYFRSVLTDGSTVSLRDFPETFRWQYNRAPDQFATEVPGMKSVLLSTLTNGTIPPQLRVYFSPAAWYEFNYGTFAAVAQVVPGLLERMRPGEAGVVLINNAMYQPRMSIEIPPLHGALLRQLILGRSDHEDRQVVQYLRSRAIPLLYGKASNLLQLADAEAQTAGQAGNGIRPFAILVSGEALYEDQRSKLRERFQCPVYNAYISTEGGLIAIECSRHRGLHLREHFVQVEIADRNGSIGREGSGDVLITNLVNRAQVFVRYRLGDQVTVISETCPCGFSGRTIVNLRGREAECFRNPAGVEVPSAAFDDFLVSLGVSEFQVAQRPTGTTLKWVPKDHSPGAVAETNARIHEWLRKQDWTDWVVPMPLGIITPRGGKHRRYISEVQR